MKLIFHWIVSAVAIIIAAYLLPHVAISSFLAALILAVVLAALNLLIKPILILLTLPVTVLTLGLFTLIINAFLVWLASLIVPGFVVDNFGWAILFALVLSIINMVFKHMGNDNYGQNR
jgi:putative membrane protein